MPRALSEDLRIRVIEAVDAGSARTPHVVFGAARMMTGAWRIIMSPAQLTILTQ